MKSNLQILVLVIAFVISGCFASVAPVVTKTASLYKAPKNVPANTEALYNNAVSLYENESYEEAARIFEQMRQFHPDYDKENVVNYIGLCYERSRGWAEALPFYLMAYNINPTSSTFTYNTGYGYYEVKNYAEAARYFEKVRELDSTYNEQYVLNFLGLCYQQTDGWEKALSYYKQAFEVASDSEIYAYNCGLAYYETENYKESLKYFRKARELDETYSAATVLNYIGLCYEQVQGWPQALPYFLQAFQADPNSATYGYNTGLGYYEIENYEEALRYFKKIREIDETYSPGTILNYIGLCHEQLYGWAEALPYFKQAFEVDPNSEIYGYNTGLGNYEIENYTKSLEAFKKVREIAPDYSAGSVLNYIGLCYEQLYGWLDALPYFRMASEADPASVIYAYNTGLGYYETKNFAEAAVYFDEVRRLDKTYSASSVLNYLGLCYERAMGWEKALPFYQEAFETDPASATYAYNTGLAYYETENYNKAIKYFKNAQEIDKEYNKEYVDEYIDACNKKMTSGEQTIIKISSIAASTENIQQASGPAQLITNADLKYGPYHALIIGINDYESLPPLKTAVGDAEAVAKLLGERYGFNIRLLTNATRYDIISALSKLRVELTAKDNLLIYYAGHGWVDKDADEGYWLPVDAERDNPANWISNASITSAVKALSAKHILIVADSCYSGKLTRGLQIRIKTKDYFMRISKKKARCVLSSGGVEPVMDDGGGGHSIFCMAFLNALEENTSIMDGTDLFSAVRRPVMLNSDQTPEYSDLRKAGHDGGDFLFIRR